MSITKMDANGRVLLPMGIIFSLDLNDGDKFAIDQLGDGTIILRKVESNDGRLQFRKWLDEETLNGFDNLEH